ncbi:hypothetical protein CEP54_004726 [Fusarium duplospermum]|uniref:Uncharacterized protein n=1 Tax=Fusarium duplospermum TaxID=1325734 RepID=A0A428QGU4_9HYPO|nr:hypothetical protein CEP54_004726 [Fusarium duplospermum]
MPLNACIENENSEVMHWLLSRDANTILGGYESWSAWQTAWMTATHPNAKERRGVVDFIEFEGVLSHLLWHNFDPHATFEHDTSQCFYPSRYTVFSSTRAQEVARAHSYYYRGPVPDVDDWEPENGLVRLCSCQDPKKRLEELMVTDLIPSLTITGGVCVECLSDNDSEYDSSASTESWSVEEDGFAYEESDLDDKQPFKSTTLFYETISTEEGRRQLAHFPLVRLLANALQLAGYRVGVDDEGNVWWDIDDGDRYFDAREYQPGEGLDDGLVANCPICQDPEKYGLGHIFAEAERAREFLREYRRKKAEEKRGQRW